MRLVQTEKLLDWMADSASADRDAIIAALEAVRTALAEVRRLAPGSRLTDSVSSEIQWPVKFSGR